MRLTDLYFSWWLRPGEVCTLGVGGLNRTYVVHTPTGHDPKTPLPAVLALHGATMNGPMMAWFSGLNQKSDEASFLAVYRVVQPEVRRVYSSEEALLLATKNKHDGQWDESEQLKE